MKTVIMKTLMLVALVSLSNVNVDANSIALITAVSEEKVVTLTLEESTSEFVEVKIVDTDGIELLEEKFSTKTTKHRKYNLKNLPQGKYFLKVYDNQKIVTRDINLGYSKVSVGKEETLYKPRITFVDGSWRVSHLAQGKSTRILIKDQDNNELINDKIKETIINKIYNLEKLESGSYKIIISTDNQSFSQTIAKA